MELTELSWLQIRWDSSPQLRYDSLALRMTSLDIFCLPLTVFKRNYSSYLGPILSFISPVFAVFLMPIFIFEKINVERHLRERSIRRSPLCYL